MKVVVIASQKGGSGKTTVAAHVAVAAELAGRGPVILVDTDPQQTLTTWWNLRQAETPKLATIVTRDIAGQLEALAAAGFAYCLIDTPPALTEQNRVTLQYADLVLVPARPSANDLWALGATLDIVRQSGAPFCFVLTQAKQNARVTVQSIAALSAHGQVLESIVHDRVAFADCMTDGRTAQEISPSSPAALEATALWKCVEKRLSTLAKDSETHQEGSHDIVQAISH